MHYLWISQTVSECQALCNHEELLHCIKFDDITQFLDELLILNLEKGSKIVAIVEYFMAYKCT